MKKFFADFKTFALKGNVIDLAAGVIIGAAFKSIVDSLVADIISPLLGLFGASDLADLSDLSLTVGNAQLRYGAFLAALINFLLMALIIFFLVKLISRLLSATGFAGKKTSDDTKICPYCKSAIHKDAVRCPSCTSILEKIDTDNSESKE